MKKKFYTLAVCSLLAISSTVVFASTPSEVSSNIPSISKTNTLSERVYTPSIALPESKDSTAVITNRPISGSNSYSTYWTQNQAHSYYKVNYVNNSSVGATLYIKSTNGDSHELYVKANSEKAIIVENAYSGKHTIDIESSNGSVNLSGKLSVKSSDNPIN